METTLTFEQFKATEHERNQRAEYAAYLETEKQAAAKLANAARLAAFTKEWNLPENVAARAIKSRKEAADKAVSWTLFIVSCVILGVIIAHFAPASTFSIPVTIVGR